MAQTLTAYELESRLVGALLLRGDALHELPAGFSSSVIGRDELRRVFGGLERLAKRGALPAGRVDDATIAAEARLEDEDRGILELARMAGDDVLGRTADVAQTARALLDRHRRSELRGALKLAHDALGGDVPTDDVAGQLVAKLLDLNAGDRPETRSWREAGLEWVDAVEAAQKGEDATVRSGFGDLDRVVRLSGGKFVVLAARPGVGKTTLALNIADNIALTGAPVLVHSLEMDDAELVTLAMSRATNTDTTAFFGGEPLDWTRVLAEMDVRCRTRAGADDGSLHFNTAHHSLGAILRITEKMHRKHGLGLVVVDYLQLVECRLGKGHARNDEVSAVSRALKSLAMRLRIPVLALSQLNRESEKRYESRGQRKPKDDKPQEIPPPQLHDLRDSGAIEQDANTVLFLHNPHANSLDEIARKTGPFALTVAKNRGGKKARISLLADLPHARFRAFSNAG